MSEMGSARRGGGTGGEWRSGVGRGGMDVAVQTHVGSCAEVGHAWVVTALITPVAAASDGEATCSVQRWRCDRWRTPQC